MAYSATELVAWAALNATFSLLQSLVESGTIGKTEIAHFETAITGILGNDLDGIGSRPTEMSARIEAQLAPMLARIYQAAKH